MTNNDILTTVIEGVAGHDVLPLVDVLKGRKNVSEFTIAEELKEEINTIRNKLYRLYDSNLVEFTRKKDKKKGWYIYYWTFVPSRIPYLLSEMKKKKLAKLKERLNTEQSSNFFECPNNDMRLTFEKAVDFEFKCPECGELMHQIDNVKRVEQIESEIRKLETDTDSDFVIASPTEIIEQGSEVKRVKVIMPKPIIASVSQKKVLKKKK